MKGLNGCDLCDIERKRSDKEKFIKKSKKIHGDKYDYSLVEYVKNNINVKIICPIHGIFEQKPMNHLVGKGCLICKESKGEIKINNFLLINNVEFIREYRFKDCKNIKTLPFDFYLPEHNICIEYDGIQHFKEVKNWGGKKGYELIKERDKIKNEYCIKNDIKLIRIPYYVYSNIEEKLKEILCQK